MIIQNIHSTPQPKETSSRIGDAAPHVGAEAANANPSSSVKDETGQPSTEQLRNAAKTIDQAMQESNHSLEIEFSVDSDTKKTVVRVVNTKTGELVRQIPSKEILAIARSIDQFQHGLLLSQKA